LDKNTFRHVTIKMAKRIAGYELKTNSKKCYKGPLKYMYGTSWVELFCLHA